MAEPSKPTPGEDYLPPGASSGDGYFLGTGIGLDDLFGASPVSVLKEEHAEWPARQRRDDAGLQYGRKVVASHWW